MKARNKRLFKAITATALAVTMLCSSAITAFAGSNGSVTTGGGVSGHAEYLIDPNGGVLKITASYLTNDSSIATMANLDKRYGNLKAYPLLMHSGTTGKDHCFEWSSNIATAKNDATTEYNNWIGTLIHNSNRDKVQSEYDGESGDHIITYADAKGGSSTVYLEDCIKAVFDSTTLSNDDKLSFWYFYTRMAAGANADGDIFYEEPSALGNKLNNVINTDPDSVSSNDNRIKRFQRGYVVALAFVYGVNSAPVRKLQGGSSFTTVSSYLDWDWWQAPYKSITVERMQALYVTTDSSGIKKADVLFSMTDFLSLTSNKGFHTVDSPTKESLAFDSYGGCGSEADTCYIKGSSESMGFYSVLKMIAPSVKSSSGIWKPVKEDGNIVFGGWGFFDFNTSSTDVKDLLIDPQDTKQIATEITYNAFLTSNKDSSYTGESNAFSDNGHVMTDTVYLSDIDSKFFKSEIKDTKYYLGSTVDKSISLSTPIADTEYTLKRLQYQISTANGSNGVDNYNLLGKGNNVSYDENSSNVKVGGISILGSDINTALTNENSKYYVRIKSSLKGSTIETEPFDLYKWNGSKYTKITSSDCAYGTTTKAIYNKTKSAIVGSYSSTDVDGKSTNLYYICLDSSKKYYPVYYSYGTWYYCPVECYQNILVQIRADYVASYDKGTDLYNEMFKASTFDEYLLAKNDSSSSFTKKQQLYSMIDNYCTSYWGTLCNRNYATTISTGDTALLRGTSTAYDRGSLLRLDGYFYGIGSYNGGWNNIAWADIGVSKKAVTTPIKLQQSSSVLTNANKRKLEYITTIEKTVPTLLNNKESSTFLSSNLSVNVSNFNASGAKSNTSSTNKTNVWYTGDKSSIKSKDTVIKELGDNLRKTSVTNLDMPWYRSEYTIKSYDKPLKVNITKLHFGSTDSYFPSNSTTSTGYAESVFAKLLVAYDSYIYTKRAEASSVSTPLAAQWISGNAANAENFGLTSSNTSKTLKKESGVYSGFTRFGSTTMQNSNGTNMLRRILNNNDINPSVSSIITDSNVDTSVVKTSYWGTNYSFTEPFTQNSYDIPIIYDFNIYTPNTISQYTPTTTTTHTSSTIAESSYQYNLKVYPEVTMWAENKSSTSKSNGYTSIVTVGQKLRSVPVVTYNKLDLSTPSPSSTVTGTAIALDTRATALATRLGAAKAAVFYSGSGINVAVGSAKAGTVSTYVLDFNDKISGYKALKSLWGNSDKPVLSSVQKFINKLSVDVDTSVAIKDGTAVKNTIDFGSKEGKINTSSEPTEQGYIALTVKGGILTEVAYSVNGVTIKYTVNNADTNSTSLTFKSGNVVSNSTKEVAIKAEVLDILKGTKVVGKDNVLVKSFQNGGGTKISSKLKSALGSSSRYSSSDGWYYEDTSVLAIKIYSTDYSVTGGTYTDQIPLNYGPSTPTDKNNYFSNGYTGTVNCTYTFDYNKKGFNIITKTDNSNVDFIISDVTINDATTY